MCKSKQLLWVTKNKRNEQQPRIDKQIFLWPKQSTSFKAGYDDKNYNNNNNNNKKEKKRRKKAVKSRIETTAASLHALIVGKRYGCRKNVIYLLTGTLNLRIHTHTYTCIFICTYMYLVCLKETAKHLRKNKMGSH